MFMGNGWGAVQDNRDSNTSMAELTDGSSNTIAVSEMAVYNGNPRDIKGSHCMSVGSVLATNPSVVLSFKGPNGQLNCTVGAVATSHWRRGQGWAPGYLMDIGFQTVVPPNSANASESNGEWTWGIYPPSSYHPGGVTGGFADGSVRFISDTIDTGNLASAEAGAIGSKRSPYGVWGAMGSINGGEPSSQ
jgi:prepilin-type processing-associated H-X9-DG protein